MDKNWDRKYQLQPISHDCLICLVACDITIRRPNLNQIKEIDDQLIMSAFGIEWRSDGTFAIYIQPHI